MSVDLGEFAGSLELDLLPWLTRHDRVSILADPGESNQLRTSFKVNTNLMEFSSVKDLSALLGFSGDRTRIVVSSNVCRYG